MTHYFFILNYIYIKYNVIMSAEKSLQTAINHTQTAGDNFKKIENAIKVTNSLNTAIDNLKNNESLESFINRHNYKLGSHNTMSYLTPLKWYFRPIAFTAKCQSKTIQEQYEIYGVRLFDLRFKFNKKGEVHFAHGAIEYKGNIGETLNYLNSLDNIPVRIMLENKPGDKESEFKAWCEYLEDTYKNIKFFGGRNKWNWEELYKFKHEHPKVEDKYSSCNTNEPGKPQTGTYIDDLCPIWYAKKNNKINRKNGTIKDYLMIDFVEIE